VKEKIEEHLQNIEGSMGGIREILMSEEFAKSVGEKEEDTPVLKKPLGRVALVVGHTYISKGAFSPILGSEYDYNAKVLGPAIVRTLDDLGIKGGIFYRDQGGYKGAYDALNSWGADIVIELHFNAFNGKASGAEILLATDKDRPGLHEKELAINMVAMISDVLNIPNRGLKYRPSSKRERGWHLVNQTHTIPSILIEPFFGDNEDDAKSARVNIVSLAAAIALPCKTLLEGGYE
jgi:N-acetylmuramoyl-L-alanine amidase